MKRLWAVLIISIICVPAVLAEKNLLEQGSAVGFKINTDRGGTIQNAFITILSAAGLKNVNNNFDCLLDVNVTITPIELTNVTNMEFVRIDLIANLIDNDGRILLPYAVSWRVGHVNRAMVEDRAFREAVMKINAEYRNLLNDIL